MATDSYRLAVRDLPGVEGTPSTLVPFRALREIGRTIGDQKMTVDLGDREATFASDRGTLTARLIEGTFPNYRQLLPDSLSEPARRFPGRAARGRRPGFAGGRGSHPGAAELHEGGVELSVSRQEVGEETEHLEAEYTGEDMTIAFNTRYLTDGVTAVDTDEVILDTIDPLKPG